MRRHSMHMQRFRVLRQAAWASIGRVGTQAAGFIALVLIARILTPADVGLYLLLSALVAFAIAAGRLGTTEIVVRRIAFLTAAGDTGTVRRAIREGAYTSLWGLLFLAVAVASPLGHWALDYAVDGSVAPTVMVIASALIVLRGMELFVAEAFRGLHDIRAASVFGGLTSYALLALILAVMGLTAPAWGVSEVMTAWLAASAASACLAFVAIRTRVRGFNPMEEKAGALQRRTDSGKPYSFSLGMNGLIVALLSDAGIWVVSITRSTGDAAIYGTAARTAVAISTPLLIAQALCSPRIAKLYADGNLRYLEALLRRTATIVVMVVLLGSAIFWLKGDAILSFVFGPQYGGAASVLHILLMGQVVSAASGLCGLTLIMAGFEGVVLRSTLTSTVLMLTLGLFGSVYVGVEGVALAATVSLTVQNVWTWLAVRRRIGVWSHAAFTTRQALK